MNRAPQPLRHKHEDDSVSALRRRFRIYTSANLRGITPLDFRRALESRIGTVDAGIEGFDEEELEQQRDLSVKFHWGHNHDFGEFQVAGRMGDRHLELFANFCSLFPVSSKDFLGKSVFDVGCWTGGTTLLLATMAADVVAIEEVRKYAETTSFLAKCFGVDGKIAVKPTSVYDCNSSEYYERFDIVYFPGVLYHLSDPLLALRILFNSLKVGGVILVESMGVNTEEPICRFDGSRIWSSGSKEKLDRAGWNWFIPSPTALDRMMLEAGFAETQTLWHTPTGRVYGYGVKTAKIGMCKAGLSVRGIP